MHKLIKIKEESSVCVCVTNYFLILKLQIHEWVELIDDDGSICKGGMKTLTENWGTWTQSCWLKQLQHEIEKDLLPAEEQNRGMRNGTERDWERKEEESVGEGVCFFYKSGSCQTNGLLFI